MTSSYSVSPSHVMTDRDHNFSAFTFTMVGLVSLYAWNAILDEISDITKFIYGNQSWGDTIVIAHETFNVIVIIYFVIRGGVRPRFLTAITFLFGIFMLFIPLIPQILPGQAGIILLHVATLPLGFAVGCVLATGFSTAAVMPVNFSGHVAFGMGISGIATFFLWVVFNHLVFFRIDPTSYKGKQALLNSTWAMFVIGTCVSVITGISLLLVIQKDWFKDRVCTYWRNLALQREAGHDTMVLDDEEEIALIESPCRKTALIVKDSWVQLFNSGFTLFLTLLLFPQIGPFGWVGTNLTDINVGIFQFGDFLGRYLPNSGKWLRVSRKYLVIGTLLRLGFIPLFIFAMILRNTIFNTFWLQAIIIIACSLSNGWILTQAVIYAPDCVNHLKEKGRVGTYTTLSMQICVIAGLILSKVFKLLLSLAAPSST